MALPSRFIYEAPLLDYMREKGMTTIAVEVVSAAHSDIEVTELHIHLVRNSQAAYFKEKKKFRGITTEHGEVLLPNYRLEYDDTVRFSLKKLWFFRSVKCEGIRL